VCGWLERGWKQETSGERYKRKPTWCNIHQLRPSYKEIIYAINHQPSTISHQPSAIIIPNKLLLWCFVALGVLISFVLPTAKGSLSCSAPELLPEPESVTHAAITTPVDFDSLPNGTIVSKLQSIFYRQKCYNYNPQSRIGPRINIIPGYEIVNQETNIFNHPWYGNNKDGASQIHTEPALKLRGLGIIIYAFQATTRSVCTPNGTVGSGGNTTLTGKSLPLQEQPVLWSTHEIASPCHNGGNVDYILIDTLVRFNFVKIGNSSQHTTAPQNFTVTILSISFYSDDAPSVPASTIVSQIQVTNFAANVQVRTCTTPTASQSLIDFGHYNQGSLQSMAPGTVFSQQNFTFTFVCPRKQYDTISFLVEPVYGIESAYPGTMRIAQGIGMASGVGVQLFLKHLRGGWSWDDPLNFHPVIYISDPLSNSDLASHTGYPFGKYKLFWSQPNGTGQYSYEIIDGEPSTIQQTVSFKANLIRLPGPLQPGRIKAAALIHIRYN